MKRPSFEDLAMVRAVLQIEARSLEASEPFRLAIERVEPWLAAEAERALTRTLTACTAGRSHRVREIDNQGDGITVERCRCGARRVRDARRVGDEVTDWRHPLPSSPEADRGA